jgi:hypothetical protein
MIAEARLCGRNGVLETAADEVAGSDWHERRIDTFVCLGAGQQRTEFVGLADRVVEDEQPTGDEPWQAEVVAGGVDILLGVEEAEADLRTLCQMRTRIALHQRDHVAYAGPADRFAGERDFLIEQLVGGQRCAACACRQRQPHRRVGRARADLDPRSRRRCGGQQREEAARLGRHLAQPPCVLGAVIAIARIDRLQLTHPRQHPRRHIVEHRRPQ